MKTKATRPNQIAYALTTPKGIQNAFKALKSPCNQN